MPAGCASARAYPHSRPLLAATCRELARFVAFASPFMHTLLSFWRKRGQSLNRRAQWKSVRAKSLITKEAEELVKK